MMDNPPTFDDVFPHVNYTRRLEQQNAALVEALSGSDELIDRLKGHFGDWWGGSKIAHKTVEIQQANRQALALAEGDE